MGNFIEPRPRIQEGNQKGFMEEVGLSWASSDKQDLDRGEEKEIWSVGNVKDREVHAHECSYFKV